MTDRENLPSDVDDVRRWLAAAGAEVEMPAGVVQRVQQTLAAEASARSAATRPDVSRPAPGARPVADLPREGAADEPRLRWLVAASVAALAVLGSAVVIPLLGQAGDDSAAETSAVAEADLRGDADAADASGGSRVQAEPGAGEQGAGGSSLDTAESALPGVPVDLLDTIGSPGATPAPRGCGTLLADEIGAEVLTAVLVGTSVANDDVAGDSVNGERGVLVVTQTSSEDAVWWMPSCSAVAAEALGRSPLGPAPRP